MFSISTSVAPAVERRFVLGLVAELNRPPAQRLGFGERGGGRLDAVRFDEADQVVERVVRS